MAIVFVVERCGNIFGVPGNGPDGHWVLYNLYGTKEKAEKVVDDHRSSEWEHWRYRKMKVL